MENIRILLVDDQSAMRVFLKATIKASFPSGIEIAEASGGEAAMNLLSSQPFDIVLCDWNMPGMKGTELLEWVRGRQESKDAQFLMLTAHNSQTVVTGTISAGVNDFIVKPVSVETLSRKLQSALDRVLITRRTSIAKEMN